MTADQIVSISAERGIDLSEVTDPVALAVRLHLSGMSVKDAAELCGVGRTALHRKIKQIKLASVSN